MSKKPAKIFSFNAPIPSQIQVFLLTLALIASPAVSAQEVQSSQRQQSLQNAASVPFQKVPDEYFVVEIPSLAATGSVALSWGFLRPPELWVQGKTFDFTSTKWPQWNLDQMPFTMVPSMGAVSQVLTYDENKNKLEQVDLDQPLSFKDPKMRYFQVMSETAPPYLRIYSPIYSWEPPKEVFSCEIEVNREEDLEKNKQLKTCLSTLRKLPENAQQQWYAWVETPTAISRESWRFVGSQIREIAAIYRKSNHFLLSQRGAVKNKLVVHAGVTNKEKIHPITFAYDQIQKAEYALIPPSSEVKEKVAHSQTFEDGSKIEIMSYAIDSVDERAIQWGKAPNIDLQFVSTNGSELRVRSTQFREERTGFSGFLRPWRLAAFGTYNSLTSNRGEKDSTLNLIGLDVGYKWNYWGLDPHLIFESGVWHPTSSLSIQEIQLGISKAFFSSLPALRFSTGYHSYALSGKNPGSSRLGRMDALALGALTQTQSGDVLVRGRIHGFVTSSFGFESRLEVGKILHGITDIPEYFGIFVGYSRYAALLQNRATLVKEVYSEDRLCLGGVWGFLGPDSF